MDMSATIRSFLTPSLSSFSCMYVVLREKVTFQGGGLAYISDVDEPLKKTLFLLLF